MPGRPGLKSRLGGCQVSCRVSFSGDSASQGVLARASACTPVTSTAAMPAAIIGWATPARIRPAVWAVTSGAFSPGPLRTSRRRWDGGDVEHEPVQPEPGLRAAQPGQGVMAAGAVVGDRDSTGEF